MFIQLYQKDMGSEKLQYKFLEYLLFIYTKNDKINIIIK